MQRQQSPPASYAAAATAHGLLPLSAAAAFPSFLPSPSPSPSLSQGVHAAESVASCCPAESEEQAAPGSQLRCRDTAGSRFNSGTTAAAGLQPSHPQRRTKRPRELPLQPSAGGPAPAACRLVLISAGTLAALAAVARRCLGPLLIPAPEGSGDNFGGDESEVDSGSVRSMHDGRSAKRQRVHAGLRAAAVYRAVSAAAAARAAAAAAQQAMG